MNIDVRKALTQSGSDDNVRVTVNVWASDTPELRAILTKHFPAWAELFARKNSEYGSGSAFDLGERGQFSDIYRKIIKLKRAMWDEDESVLTTEGVDEIIMDLIGHCFLTLEMRARKDAEKTNSFAVNSVSISPAMMTQDDFEAMVQKAGMFVIPNEDRGPKKVDSEPKTQTADSDALNWTAPDGRRFSVGDNVRLKQHLGKGPVYVLRSIDPYDARGMIFELNNPMWTTEQNIFVHPTWVYKDGDKSPEELALDSRPIADNPQA